MMENFAKAVWILVLWLVLAAVCVTMAGGVLAVEPAEAAPVIRRVPVIRQAEEELVIRSVAYACGGSRHLGGAKSAKPAATYAARVGVAATILNRMEDPRFPDAAELVIASDPAFSPTALTAPLTETELALSAAALEGAKSGFDPTEGALYFSLPGDVPAFTVTCVFDGYAFGVP